MRSTPPLFPPTKSGFTLIEMSIVLVVLGLLLGGFMGPLSLQLENNQRREARSALEKINEALIGYALVNGHLPCPDTDNDGRENRSVNRCSEPGTAAGVGVGTLPWLDIGVGRMDPWNGRFTYAVSEVFADSSVSPLPNFSLSTKGGIEIVGGIDAAPLVVVSHGPNGRGSFSVQGTPRVAPVGNAEQENSDGDRHFVLAPYNNARGKEFDDMVSWISPYILKNRLLLAGKMASS